MSEESSVPGHRNIRIDLSEQATLKAVRVSGGFDILVGEDVVIRGVTTDHMRSLVGSVLDAFVPADMASRVLKLWPGRGTRPGDESPADTSPDPSEDAAEEPR